MSGDAEAAGARVLREALRSALDRAAGVTPVVLIDGPSGAGKSSLADVLPSLWPVPRRPRIVRMDDVYPGWDGLDAASESIGRDLLAPLAAGGTGRWRRWDWDASAPAEWNTVAGPDPVIVEGCGTLSRANARLAHLCVWLDADDSLRKERALARDGETFATHWDQWQSEFDRYVLREDPRARADVVLDVTRWPIGALGTRAEGTTVGI